MLNTTSATKAIKRPIPVPIAVESESRGKFWCVRIEVPFGFNVSIEVTERCGISVVGYVVYSFIVDRVIMRGMKT